MKNQKKVFQSLTLILQFGLNMIVPKTSARVSVLKK